MAISEVQKAALVCTCWIVWTGF